MDHKSHLLFNWGFSEMQSFRPMISDDGYCWQGELCERGWETEVTEESTGFVLNINLMHPKCLVLVQIHAVKSTVTLIIKYVKVQIYFLLAMNTTRGITWVHLEDSKSRTYWIPLGWAPRLTEQGWNQYFSWVEASGWEGIKECLLQLPPNLSPVWYCCRVLKEIHLYTTLPASVILQMEKFWVSLLNHILSQGALWSMQNIFTYMHTCQVREQFLLWIGKLIALVHATFSMELQSTIMYHRLHISRTQNNSGLINSVTYINTKVRHVCDSFMPHGSFLGTTTQNLQKYQT